MKKFAFLIVPFLLMGCEAIGNLADNTGESFPVINEKDRCEHWECISESGQKKSAENKKLKAKDLKAKITLAGPLQEGASAPTNNAPLSNSSFSAKNK